jgi:hypothetical protein
MFELAETYHDEEDDGEHAEAHELDRLAADLVDEEEGRPVAGDEASNDEDEVADTDLVQVVRDERLGARLARPADGREDERRVEAETVEGDVESEPRPGRAEEDLEVLPLAVVRHEVTAGCLRRLDALDLCVRIDVEGALREGGLDVLGRLRDVALDVHGETRGLRDRQAEVERDARRHAAETDEETPHVVNRLEVVELVLEETGRVRLDDDECDDGSDCRLSSGSITISSYYNCLRS